MEDKKISDSQKMDFKIILILFNIFIIIFLIVTGYIYGVSKAFNHKRQIIPLSFLGITSFLSSCSILASIFYHEKDRLLLDLFSFLFVLLSPFVCYYIIYRIPSSTEEIDADMTALNLDTYKKFMDNVSWNRFIPINPGPRDLSSRRFYVDFQSRNAVRDLIWEINTKRSLYLIVPKDINPMDVDSDISHVLYSNYAAAYKKFLEELAAERSKLLVPNGGPAMEAYKKMGQAIELKISMLREDIPTSTRFFQRLSYTILDVDLEQVQACADPYDVKVEKIHNVFYTSDKDIDNIKKFIRELMSLPHEERYSLLHPQAKSIMDESLGENTDPSEDLPVIVFLLFKSKSLRKKIAKNPSNLGLTILK